MPIIAKDIRVEPKTPPVNEKEENTVTEENRYHEVYDGDLHKLFNKKSEYLRDMLDLTNNK